nr:MMPL family transporter [Paenibacillus lemnae]
MVPLALQLPSLLQQNGFTPEHSDALEGARVLEEKLGISSTMIDLVIVSRTGENLTTGAAQKRILEELRPLQDQPYVQDLFMQIASRKQGQDHIQAVTVQLNEDTADVLREFDVIRKDIPEISGADTYLAGNTAVFADMNQAVKKDIVRAEMIGIPLALIILLFVFGTWTAAILPIIGGLISVTVTMGLLYFAALWNGSISNFLPNVVTMLGLAVGIDYALFVVSRFREELQENDPEQAVARSCASAGKAVIFSGAAVWIGFLAMAFIDLPIFTSFSIGGIAVVLVSVLAANTLLPALLGMMGHRIHALPVFSQLRLRKRSSRMWRRISTFVMARPAVIAVIVIALLLVAMAPVTRMKVGIPAAEVLPPSYESRYGYDLMKQAYDERELNPIVIAAELPGRYDTPESIQAVKHYMDEVRKLPEVRRVESYLSVLPRGTPEQIADELRLSGRADIFQRYHIVSDKLAAVAVVSQYGDSHELTQKLVSSLRSMEAPGLTIHVTGNPPYKLDIIEEIERGIPLVLMFVFITTYIVLFAAFRSVILPLKAVLMNVLSLGAALGLVVWVFQEGAGAQWLGVSSTGTVFALLPVLIFCVVFGISMDYEVILLSRIQERYEITGDNEVSTMEGLEYTGGMITSAALILAAVVGAFIFTDNEVMKAMGLGLTAAVLLDASVVRILLVPAFMKLLGRANWWAPKWIRYSNKK